MFKQIDRQYRWGSKQMAVDMGNGSNIDREVKQ